MQKSGNNQVDGQVRHGVEHANKNGLKEGNGIVVIQGPDATQMSGIIDQRVIRGRPQYREVCNDHRGHQGPIDPSLGGRCWRKKHASKRARDKSLRFISVTVSASATTVSAYAPTLCSAGRSRRISRITISSSSSVV